MAFETGTLDAFSDTEGPPMTGWATPALAAGLKSASGVCLANAANALGVWNSVLAHADCEARAIVSTATASSGIVYVFARLKDIASAATLDGYSVSVTEAATDTWAINSVTNGVASAIGATFTQEVSNGDAIGIRCIGSTISAWYKASGGSWTQLATRTDSTYAAAGYIGLGLTDTTGRLDDFGGGIVATLVSLDALTLASSAPTLVVTPGATSIALNALTLAGTAQTLTVTPGAAQVTLNALTIAGSVQSLSVTPGAAAVSLDVLTLAGSVPSLTVTAGAIAVPLDALSLLSAAQNLTVTPGAAQITLDALILTGTAQTLVVTPGSTSVALDALAATWSVPDLTVNVSGGAQSTALDALTIAGSVPSLTVTPGSASVTLDALLLAGSALTLVVTPGGALVALDSLTLASALNDLSVMTGAASVSLDAILLTGSVSDLTVTPGGITTGLDALTIVSSILDLTVTLSVNVDGAFLTVQTGGPQVAAAPQAQIVSTHADALIGVDAAQLIGQKQRQLQ